MFPKKQMAADFFYKKFDYNGNLWHLSWKSQLHQKGGRNFTKENLYFNKFFGGIWFSSWKNAENMANKVSGLFKAWPGYSFQINSSRYFRWWLVYSWLQKAQTNWILFNCISYVLFRRRSMKKCVTVGAHVFFQKFCNSNINSPFFMTKWRWHTCRHDTFDFWLNCMVCTRQIGRELQLYDSQSNGQINDLHIYKMKFIIAS